MTDALSEEMVNEVTRQLEAGLAKIKYDYQKNLLEMDPLDRDALEKMLTVFNQRLVIFQHEFMEYLSKVRGGMDPHTEELVVEALPLDRIPKIASSIVDRIGDKIVPDRLAKERIRIVRRVVGRVLGVIGMRNYRRKLMHKALIAEFDKDIAPSLRAWAQGKITGE